MKPIAIYLRCSTNEQNPEVQLNAINKYIECQGWKLGQVYTDEGISGAKDQRPELDKLKQAVMKGKYSKVIVFKFDRLARSTRHLLSCLQLFQNHKVDFISVTEGIDTSTSIGKMIFTFLAAIAEFERSLIQERVKAALTLKKEQGIKLGRPRVGFDIGQALKLKSSGKSYRTIAKALDVSLSTLHRGLKAIEGVSQTPISNDP